MTRASPALPLNLPTEQKSYARTKQWDKNRCYFCGEPESRERPFVAVLTYIHKDERHFIHAGECHIKHSDRIRSEREQHYREKGKAA